MKQENRNLTALLRKEDSLFKPVNIFYSIKGTMQRKKWDISVKIPSG